MGLFILLPQRLLAGLLEPVEQLRRRVDLIVVPAVAKCRELVQVGRQQPRKSLSSRPCWRCPTSARCARILSRRIVRRVLSDHAALTRPPRKGAGACWYWPLDARVEPPLEVGTPPSVARQGNPEAQLTEDDRIYGDFTFVVAQPLDHFDIGSLLVGSLRTFASTRYLTTRRSILIQREQKSPSRDRRTANRPRLHSPRPHPV